MSKKTVINLSFIIIVLLLGLVNMNNNLAMYYFGCLFFIPAIVMTVQELHEPMLLFMPLCTHGLTGITIMLLSIFTNVLNPNNTKGDFNFDFIKILGDNRGLLIPYLCLSGLIIILGFIFTIIYNKNSGYRKKDYSLIIVYSLFIIGIAMIIFLPKIIMYL